MIKPMLSCIVKKNFETGWHEGKIYYYNQRLCKYLVTFSYDFRRLHRSRWHLDDWSCSRPRLYIQRNLTSSSKKILWELLFSLSWRFPSWKKLRLILVNTEGPHKNLMLEIFFVGEKSWCSIKGATKSYRKLFLYLPQK